VAKLLVVEDDAAIAEPLARALRRDGHEVTCVATGKDALEQLAAALPDLVLLDLGLSDMDGLEVCRQAREHDAAVPIIMLTARTEELDTVVGLDAGADDYVTKPFRLAELLARIRSQLRRRAPSADAAQDVRVDAGARRAWKADEELTLTPKEFDLLALLVREAGTVVSRERIMELVWDEHWYGSTKTLDMHVSWLRRKLGDEPSHPRYITTIRGVGLRFERELPRVPADE
jgi:DNA-binding response OmpR family regulator